MGSAIEGKGQELYRALISEFEKSKEFKQLYFERKHPESRVRIYGELTSIIGKTRNKLAKIIFPFNALSRLFSDSKMDLSNLYHQVYHLFNEENIRQFRIDINNALADQTIDLSDHYLAIDILDRLSKFKDEFKKLAMGNTIESKSRSVLRKDADLKERIEYKKCMQRAIHASGITTYLTNTIEKDLSSRLFLWEMHNKELDIYQSSGMFDPTNQDDVDTLSLIHSESVERFSMSNRAYAMACAFSKVNKRNLNDIIAFIENYRIEFSDTLNEKLSRENILYVCIQLRKKPTQPSFKEWRKIKDSQATHVEVKKTTNRFHSYTSIHQDVGRFIESLMHDEKDKDALTNDFKAYAKAWGYISTILTDQNMPKDFYLLAFMQNVIHHFYQCSPCDKEIASLNKQIMKMLCNTDCNPIKQQNLIKASIVVLIEMTSPKKMFESFGLLTGRGVLRSNNVSQLVQMKELHGEFVKAAGDEELLPALRAIKKELSVDLALPRVAKLGIFNRFTRENKYRSMDHKISTAHFSSSSRGLVS